MWPKWIFYKIYKHTYLFNFLSFMISFRFSWLWGILKLSVEFTPAMQDPYERLYISLMRYFIVLHVYISVNLIKYVKLAVRGSINGKMCSTFDVVNFWAVRFCSILNSTPDTSNTVFNFNALLVFRVKSWYNDGGTSIE